MDQIYSSNKSRESSREPRESREARELRLLKKEMAIIVKENQKLQTDLKLKNETIASILDQNFSELKLLQEKNEKITDSLSVMYNNNIKEIEEKYKLFRSSFHAKLREYVHTHNKVSGERILLLSNQNNELSKKLQEISIELEDKNLKIKNLDSDLSLKIQELIMENSEQQKKYCILETQCLELEKIRSFLENKNNEIMLQYDSCAAIKNHHEKIISELSIMNTDYQQNIYSLKQKLQEQSETINFLTAENETSKKTYNDLHNKYLLVLNDNNIKQTSIDEKTVDIISLNSKISGLEHKTNLYETDKKEINMKITGFMAQIENLQTDLFISQKTVSQLRAEKENITEEKNMYSQETDKLKNKLKEFELDILERIKKIQDEVAKEKEKYVKDNEFKLSKYQTDHEKQLMTLKTECNTLVADRDKQIEGLTSHLKSFTDNQHIVLSEVEKLRTINEKLRSDNSTIDQRVNELMMKHRLEMDELKMIHKKEKDVIMESYNENIKKSQDLNEALQHRLNQTMEALSLSKTAISNLKESNHNMEKQIYTRESDNNSFQEKYDRLRSETIVLKEKLDRSIELNNNFSLKEKQYESQLKQLQTNYSKLLALTKRGISNAGIKAPA